MSGFNSTYDRNEKNKRVTVDLGGPLDQIINVQVTPSETHHVAFHSENKGFQTVLDSITGGTSVNPNYSSALDRHKEDAVYIKYETDSKGRDVAIPYQLSVTDPIAQLKVRSTAKSAKDITASVMATDKSGRVATEQRGETAKPLYHVTGLEVTRFAGSEAVLDQAKQIYGRENVQGSTEEVISGLEPKPDRRATLSVSPQGSENPVFISDFFITNVEEEVAEKFQLVETFSTNYIFFFGQKPRIYSISGILLNSQDKQWKNNFKAIYDSTLRGTRMAKLKTRALLTYDDVLREGYILNFRHSIQAQTPWMVPFAFSFYVTREGMVP